MGVDPAWGPLPKEALLWQYFPWKIIDFHYKIGKNEQT